VQTFAHYHYQTIGLCRIRHKLKSEGQGMLLPRNLDSVVISVRLSVPQGAPCVTVNINGNCLVFCVA